MQNSMKNIGDRQLRELFKEIDSLPTVPENLDKKTTLSLKQENIYTKKIYITRKPYIPYILAAAILLIILIPVSYILFIKGASVSSRIVLFSGEGFLSRKEQQYNILIGSKIKEKDIVKTRFNSNSIIQLGDSTLLKMLENSEVVLTKLSNKRINVNLVYGKILIRREQSGIKKIPLSVYTQNAITHCISTIFYVSHQTNITKVSSFKGKLKVESLIDKEKKDPFSLPEGKSIIIKKQDTVIKDISTEINNEINIFTNSEIIKNVEKATTLKIPTNIENVTLKINGNVINTFSKEMNVIVNPGSFSISLEKEGYIPSSDTINPGYGEKIVFYKELKRVEPELSQHLNISKIKKIYQYTNPDNSEKSMILGFCSSEKHIVAVTRTSLICINQEGKIIWSNNYGEKKKIIFDSIPVIYKNNIYCASIYTILVIDLKTGKEIKRINTPGILSDGKPIILKDDNLLLSYPEGIYSYDLIKEKLSPEPVIWFDNPNTPLVFTENIYITSYVKGQIALLNNIGRKIKEYLLETFTIIPPVFFKKSIITADMSGNLYKFSKELDLIKKSKISTGIYSMVIDNNILWVSATNGKLYMLNPNSFRIINSFFIDNNPDEIFYYYKKLFINDNFIFIGNNSGDIIVINSSNGQIVATDNVSEYPISCSVSESDKFFFTGTKGGEIIKIEYK